MSSGKMKSENGILPFTTSSILVFSLARIAGDRGAVQGREDRAYDAVLVVPARDVGLAQFRAELVAKRRRVLQAGDVEERQGEARAGSFAALALEAEKTKEQFLWEEGHFFKS